MSLPRCALLWARLPAGRGAGPRAAPCSALRALVGSFPGASGRVPCLAASSSASGGSKAPNTSLFVPLTVKPQGPSADGDVGAELTRPLDKSECGSLPTKGHGLRPGPTKCNVCSFLEPSASGPNSYLIPSIVTLTLLLDRGDESFVLEWCTACAPRVLSVEGLTVRTLPLPARGRLTMLRVCLVAKTTGLRS